MWEAVEREIQESLNTLGAKHNETLARTKRRKQQRPTDPKHGDHRTTAQQTQRRKPTVRGQPTNTRSQNKDQHQPEPDNPQATRTNRSKERIGRAVSAKATHSISQDTLKLDPLAHASSKEDHPDSKPSSTNLEANQDLEHIQSMQNQWFFIGF